MIKIIHEYKHIEVEDEGLKNMMMIQFSFKHLQDLIKVLVSNQGVHQ